MRNENVRWMTFKKTGWDGQTKCQAIEMKVNKEECLELYWVCPTEQSLPDDGDRIQSPKYCVPNKSMAIDVQKLNNCNNRTKSMVVIW
jgi:hypothetical protein